MRQIVLDTETTGLSPESGHRVIEIGAIEMVNRRLTGNHFHFYLNPDREVDYGAQQVHGITSEFLQDKPRFNEVVDAFLAYVQGAELIIHNASFDMGFLNHELRLLGGAHGALEDHVHNVIDTLALARNKHPGQRNSLDALCKRYQIDNTKRTLHGALLDSEILAEVYLAMTGGQEAMQWEKKETKAQAGVVSSQTTRLDPAGLTVVMANADELALHDEYLEKLDASSGGCVWKSEN